MQRSLPSMSLAVVGAVHPNADGSNRRFEIKLCAPGDMVELRPEPRNKKDPHAVAVYSSRSIQIGYLTAERCGRIGQLIREGRELQAIFQAESSSGAWIRVAFDGDAPILPIIRENHVSATNADWYPDEVWTDD